MLKAQPLEAKLKCPLSFFTRAVIAIEMADALISTDPDAFRNAL